MELEEYNNKTHPTLLSFKHAKQLYVLGLWEHIVSEQLRNIVELFEKKELAPEYNRVAGNINYVLGF